MVAQPISSLIINPITGSSVARDDVRGLLETLYVAEKTGCSELATRVEDALTYIGPSAAPQIIAAIEIPQGDLSVPPARLGSIATSISSSLSPDDPLQKALCDAVVNLRKLHNGVEAEILTTCLAIFPLLSQDVLEAKLHVVVGQRQEWVYRRAELTTAAPEIIESLMTCARSSEPEVKRLVAFILSSSPTDRDDIRSCLREMMNDASPIVALQAAISLASQPGRREPDLYSEFTPPASGTTYISEVLGAGNKKATAGKLKALNDAVFRNELVGDLWPPKVFENCLAGNPSINPRINGGHGPFLVIAIRPKDSGSIVGFLVAGSRAGEENQCLLANLALLNEYRGQGLAAQLLNHAEGLFARLGYTTLMRESRCAGGWAARVESNVVRRGLLLSKEEIHSSIGRQWRMVMRLPGRDELPKPEAT